MLLHPSLIRCGHKTPMFLESPYAGSCRICRTSIPWTEVHLGIQVEEGWPPPLSVSSNKNSSFLRPNIRESWFCPCFERLEDRGTQCFSYVLVQGARSSQSAPLLEKAFAHSHAACVSLRARTCPLAKQTTEMRSSMDDDNGPVVVL